MSIGKRSGTDWASAFLGIGIGLTAAIYLETTTQTDWNSVYNIIISVTRISALLGSYLALVGLVLVARMPWIEKSVGHDRLVIWHRKFGPYSMYLVTFHVLLVILGYAGNDRVPMAVELWRMIFRYPWMLPAFVGFLFFATAGITSYKKVRKGMSYETWWTIHLYTYLAIALAFMHQVLTGPILIGHPLNKLYWELLYIYSALVLVMYRFVIPNVRSPGGNIVDGVLGPWKIGIRHPEEAHTVVKVFDMWDGAVATSGTYVRGAHIRDPHTGLIAIGARSASVVGPDGGLADALATALVVAGRDGAAWFAKPELAEYKAWVKDRNEDIAWEVSKESF